MQASGKFLPNLTFRGLFYASVLILEILKKSKNIGKAISAMMKLFPMFVLHLSFYLLDFENSGVRENVAYYWAVNGVLFTLVNIKILYCSACNMQFEWFQLEPFFLILMVYVLKLSEPSVVYTVMMWFLAAGAFLMARMA